MALTTKLSWRVAAPVSLVGCGTLGLECAYGARLGDALLYLAYEAVFVVLPGCAVYGALSDRPRSPLHQLGVGWALGYVLEVLVFMLTAATGARWAFPVYPLVAVAGAVLLRRRRRRPAAAAGATEGLSPALVAVVCLIAVAYVAVSSFHTLPLPGSHTVVYGLDASQQLSIAVDARHHWPIEDPNVAGEPLPYHYFVHVHLAAAAQVTGLALPLVYFRFFMCPMVIALVLALAAAGESLLRSARVGLIAACLTFFVGELQLDIRQSTVLNVLFLGLLFSLMLSSPSFLFGLVVFVPLITLIGDRLSAARGARGWQHWLLLALFMLGAGGAKVSILPIVLVALVLYGGFSWLTSRSVGMEVWLTAGLALVIAGAYYVVEYRGHSSGLGFSAFGVFHDSIAAIRIRAALTGFLPSFPLERWVLDAVGVVVGSVGLLAASLAGVPWLVRHGRPLGAERRWLFALLGSGLLSFVFLSGEGTGNQLYSFFYGLIAGLLLSAEGLLLAWRRRPTRELEASRVGLVAVAWLTVLAMIVAAPFVLHAFRNNAHENGRYVLLYGALTISLLLLYVAARKWLTQGRWAAAALLTAALLTVGALDTPADRLWSSLTSTPAPAAPGKGVTALTPLLYRALAWIRDRSPTDSVIAVNSQDRVTANYAAFGERRVFLGGWLYSQRTRDEGFERSAMGAKNPFAARSALNVAVFSRGDQQALRLMTTRYGVRYLLVDHVNGFPAPLRALARHGRVVYDNRDATVLRVA